MRSAPSHWANLRRAGQATLKYTHQSKRVQPPWTPPLFTPYRAASSFPLRSSSRPTATRHSPSSSIIIPSGPKPMSSNALDSDSAVENIRDDLHELKHDKWGWVIYRCTYDDDEAWDRFKRIINEQSRTRLAEPDVPPETANGVEWTFVSDAASLDGVSRDQLRLRFRDWAAQAERTEQPRADIKGHWTGLRSQRYTFFVQVDRESLHSIVDADPSDPRDVGWVNLVRADEDQDFDPKGRENSDALDGDEGWMMVSRDLVGPELYDSLGHFTEDWYAYYTRPPSLLAYC